MAEQRLDLPEVTPYEVFLGEVYDLYVTGWPHEMEFWREQAFEEIGGKDAILELACGTGRVAVPLAEAGARVVGLDRWASHLDVARCKSEGLPNVAWRHADMRDFAIDEKFTLAIMPGHGFHSLNTPHDQLACLRSIRRHLEPGGRAIFHLDQPGTAWLGSLTAEAGAGFRPGADVTDPESGHRYQQRISWSYEQSTQTNWMTVIWDVFDSTGEKLQSLTSETTPIHNVFPSEMHHALELAGFEVVTVYGGFDKGQLTDASESMIWVARRP